MGVTFKYISNYVGPWDNKLNKSRLTYYVAKQTKKKIHRRRYCFHCKFGYSNTNLQNTPLYPTADKVHGLENYCQVGVCSHHKAHNTRDDIESV